MFEMIFFFNGVGGGHFEVLIQIETVSKEQEETVRERVERFGLSSDK